MDLKSNYPKFKNIKVSNSIVIGGMIAFGKSTLAEAFHKSLKNSRVIYELDDKDNLMMLLLDKMYQRTNNNLYGSLFQLYFVLNRFDNFKNNCNHESLTIFDRSIFEDWLFASLNIDKPSVFNYYNSLWESVCNELIYHHGVPKLYVILDGDWELFKARVYHRNRAVEIENFAKNELYFQHLLSIYKNYLIGVCQDFGIEYLVLDANLGIDEKVALVEKKLKEIKEDDYTKA